MKQFNNKQQDNNKKETLSIRKVWRYQTDKRAHNEQTIPVQW